jgi:hypothetical protein
MDAFLLALCRMRAGCIQFFGSSGLSAGAARYAPPGYGALAATEYGLPCPATGTLRGLFVKTRTAVAGDSAVVTLRKNGVATSMTCTIAASGTSAQDTSNTVSVTAGDVLSLSVTAGGGYSSGGADLAASVNLTAQ